MTTNIQLIQWIILNLIGSSFAQIALFLQTQPALENAPYLVKLLTSEFWASMQWGVTIPAFRMGAKFLNPAQLFLASYLFGFFLQILSNTFWLNIPTTIDDYVTMIVILFAMYVSKMRVFG